MNRPEPNFSVKVDVTNPGQFFACCGLLELADRLRPGAEGWFEERQFYVTCESSLDYLLQELTNTEINSSLGDDGLRRLGTLLSAKKSDLSLTAQQEKAALRKMWQQESLVLGHPFDLELNWWRDERNERTPLKTWAAKQLILDIVRPLLSAVREMAETPPFEEILQRAVPVDGLPLYFDAHAQSQSTALDTGFSTYDLRHVIKEAESVKPALELFAFIGMQRFRIPRQSGESLFQFNVWSTPLPPQIAAISAAGLLRSSKDRIYQFRLLSRTKYMKAFLPATPIGGPL